VQRPSLSRSERTTASTTLLPIVWLVSHQPIRVNKPHPADALAALLVLVLLARSFSRVQARRAVDQNGSRVSGAIGSTRSRGPRPFSLHPVGVEARLVVAAPHEIAPTPVGEEADRTKATDAAPAERPFISLLGPLTIHGAKRSRRGLRATALELIAFLALQRAGAQRDEILEALWAGEDPRRSRHRLYQAVRDARRLLGDVVASERDRYWLDRDRVRVDVDDLEELLNAARAVNRDRQHSAGGDARRRQLLERALSLFRAEPMAGSDYAWAGSDIRRLRDTHAALLELVGRARLEAGEARDALDVAERGIAVDALNEALWRLALEAEGELGLREAIEARYRQLAALLDERLGLEPSKETRTLYLGLMSQT
jgi:DNA-binding SARP family transcriptional activator